MKKVFLSSLLLTLVVGIGYYFYYSLPDVAELKQKNPNTTALMDLRDEEYKKKNVRAPRQQIWISYGAISEHLKKAVLISEDAAFFSHKGVDRERAQSSAEKRLGNPELYPRRQHHHHAAGQESVLESVEKSAAESQGNCHRAAARTSALRSGAFLKFI